MVLYADPSSHTKISRLENSQENWELARIEEVLQQDRFRARSRLRPELEYTSLGFGCGKETFSCVEMPCFEIGLVAVPIAVLVTVAVALFLVVAAVAEIAVFAYDIEDYRGKRSILGCTFGEPQFFPEDIVL